MKTRLFLLIVCIFFPYMMQSQESGSVYCTKSSWTGNFDGQWSIDLAITENGFSVFSDNSWSDFVWIDDLWYGKHDTHGDTIVLHDKTNGLEMQFLKSFDTLRAIKGFHYFMKHPLVLQHPTCYTVPETDHYDTIPLSLYRPFFKRQEPLHDLPFGLYSYYDFLELALHEDMTFELLVYNTLFSKGRFEREGNLLKFYDYNMDTPFHVLVEEDGLRSCLLLGDTFILPYGYDEPNFDTIPSAKGVLKR